MSRILTAEPLYIPRYPSALYVFLKQSNIEEYIFSPFGPGWKVNIKQWENFFANINNGIVCHLGFGKVHFKRIYDAWQNPYCLWHQKIAQNVSHAFAPFLWPLQEGIYSFRKGHTTRHVSRIALPSLTFITIKIFWQPCYKIGISRNGSINEHILQSLICIWSAVDSCQNTNWASTFFGSLFQNCIRRIVFSR